MRILALVTDAFGGAGGIAQFNRDFLTAMSRYPACSEIVVLPRRMEYEEKIPSKVTYLIEAAQGKWNYLKTLIQRLFRDSKFDLILCAHIHLLPLAFLARLLRVKARIVLVLYGIEAWRMSSRPWLYFFVKKIDGFIVISEYTKNRFLEWASLNGCPSFILAPAVDLAFYHPGPKNQNRCDQYGLKNKTVMLTVARLSAAERYKGIDELMDLIPGLAKEVPGLVYVIAGDGNDRTRLEKKAETLGIRNRVIFPGFIPESEKPDLYRLADVFAMLSRGEGFGIVYLEAMACGVPVIASGIDATGDYLKNFPSVFFAHPDHPEKIKEAVLKAIEMQNKTVANLDHFSIPNFQNRVHQFLDSVA